MNLLIDIPPDTVTIGGHEYKIRSDFRTSILFELLMQDDDVEPMNKMAMAIELYFGEYPGKEAPEDVMNAIVWFYRCGRSDKEQKMRRPKKKAENDEEKTQNEDDEEDYDDSHETRAYSYDYDDEYIYAAFLAQYGIDLTKVHYLHWWKFRAMFKSLNADCQFVKIMGYRTTRITKNMSKTEKDYIRKMKKIHALPISEKEWEEQNAITEALLNGGDLTGLV